MDKDMVKKAYAQAQNERKEQQIQEIKAIVSLTLKKIETLESERENLKRQYHEQLKTVEDSIKLLKLDIEDLKEGRLDRILERQEKDKKAKQASVMVVERNMYPPLDIAVNPWRQPYQVQLAWTNASQTSDAPGAWVQVTGTVCQYAAPGAYELGDGHIVHIR